MWPNPFWNPEADSASVVRCLNHDLVGIDNRLRVTPIRRIFIKPQPVSLTTHKNTHSRTCAAGTVISPLNNLYLAPLLPLESSEPQPGPIPSPDVDEPVHTQIIVSIAKPQITIIPVGGSLTLTCSGHMRWSNVSCPRKTSLLSSSTKCPLACPSGPCVRPLVQAEQPPARGIRGEWRRPLPPQPADPRLRCLHLQGRKQ